MPCYKVRCEVEVPDSIQATDRQVEAWVSFQLHENDSLSRDNPLVNVEFEAVPFTLDVKRRVR